MVKSCAHISPIFSHAGSHMELVVMYLTFVYVGEYYIEPLSPSPIMVKYFQPVTLSFRVAVQSDGIINHVRMIIIQKSGSGDMSNVVSMTNSQVFSQDLGFAGGKTGGNYTACKQVIIMIL